MDESKDPDYESARLDYVGFVDPYALEGLLILKDDGGNFSCVHLLAKLPKT